MTKSWLEGFFFIRPEILSQENITQIKEYISKHVILVLNLKIKFKANEDYVLTPEEEHLANNLYWGDEDAQISWGLEQMLCHFEEVENYFKTPNTPPYPEDLNCRSHTITNLGQKIIIFFAGETTSDNTPEGDTYSLLRSLNHTGISHLLEIMCFPPGKAGHYFTAKD